MTMTTVLAGAPASAPAGGGRCALSRSAFFGVFPPLARDRLLARLVERRFAHGQTIFARGEPGSSMLAVIEGRVRIGVTSPEGREVLLAIVEPGEIFGELALLNGKPRSADAVALGDCRLLALDQRDFQAALRQSPEAVVRLFEIVCGRLRAANDQIEGAVLMTVEARLARLLLARAGRDGGPPVVALSQGDLGRLIGASRQEVNRHLGRWAGDGLVARGGRRLVVRDRAGLEQIGGSVEMQEKLAICRAPDTRRCASPVSSGV